MSVPASGRQHRLEADGYEAWIASVGASLRVLRHHGRDLIAPFADDRLRPAMHGAVLAPWPNRLADGRYRFGGEELRLTVNEPATRTAVHGLVCWQDFRAVEGTATRLHLTAVVAPQPGYPWRLSLDVVFSLSAEGLAQEITATNESARPAPVGLGGHPYLLAGPHGAATIGEWMLQVPAEEVLLVDEERLLPTVLVPAVEWDGGRYDFRSLRRVGDVAVNNAYTSLTRDPDGLARVRVVDADGVGARIEWDARGRWVQLYTADEAIGDARRASIAVEPMTCPPDAFTSGRDLLEVEPGGSASVGWRISAAD